MRPLASAVVEFRARGFAQLAIGVLAGGLSVAIYGTGRTVSAVTIGGVIFGGLMYAVLYSRRVKQVFAHAKPAVSPQRELASITKTRTLKNEVAPLFAFLVVTAIVFRNVAVISGISIGNGFAMVVIAQHFRRWEAEHHLRLLREPKFRWKGQRGWGRGGGVIDPEDFYSTAASS